MPSTWWALGEYLLETEHKRDGGAGAGGAGRAQKAKPPDPGGQGGPQMAGIRPPVGGARPVLAASAPQAAWSPFTPCI